MSSIPRPDLSTRPLSLQCEAIIKAKQDIVFAAWTTEFDRWFAQSGTLEMGTKPGQPYFFYNREEWGRHPHYGRLLDVKKDELVEMTWMTGDGTDRGTQGAETILKIELSPVDAGTKVHLTHSGFVNEASHDAHAENWPLALDKLDEALRG